MFSFLWPSSPSQHNKYSEEHITLALCNEILSNRSEMLDKILTILQHWYEALQKQEARVEARERELIVSEISTNV